MVWTILKWRPDVGWKRLWFARFNHILHLPRALCTIWNPVLGTHFKFSFDEIEEMVKQAEVMRELIASSGVPPPPVEAVGNKEARVTDLWLIHALEQNPIVDMHVVSVHVVT